MTSVRMEDVYEELGQPKYSYIFDRIYNSSADRAAPASDLPHAYTNPYTFETFRITRFPPDEETPFVYKEEYVFACLLRKIRYAWKFDGGTDSSGDEPHQRHSRGNNLERTASSESTSSPDVEYLQDLVEESSGDESSEARINDIIPVYVTKAYDITKGLHVHRYVHLDSNEFQGEELMLAEGLAIAYTRPDFNVELHYLELRKYHQSGKYASDR